MAYKYKLNPITGKLDLVGSEGGEGGGGIANITSADKTITVKTNDDTVDLSAPSLKMLEGYKCGFSTRSHIGNVKFCDLYWTDLYGAVDTGHIFTIIHKYIDRGTYILVTATVKFIFGNVNGTQVCDCVIQDEIIYASSTSVASYIDEVSVSKNLKIDYIQDATTTSGSTSPTAKFGHAVIFMKMNVPYGGNFEFHPLSALSIKENNSNLCFFIMNPECVKGDDCSDYTPTDYGVRDAKVVAGGDTSFLQAQINLLAKGVKLSLSSNATIIEKDVTTNVSWVASFDESCEKIEKYVNGAITASSSNIKSLQSSVQLNDSAVLSAKAYCQGLEFNASINITAVNCILYGFCASGSNPTKKMTPRTSALTTYEDTATANGQVFCIYVPNSGVNKPTKFSMGGAPASFTQGTKSIGGISYTAFISDNTYNSGIKLTIKAE